MSNSSHGAYGMAAYVATASQIAARDRRLQPLVLARMLFAKACFGLSATEYGQYGLQDKPFVRLGDYRTKKQTTALFERVNPATARPQVDDKLYFHRLCMAAGLPVPTLHAVLSQRGTRIDDFPLLSDFSAVLRHFDGQNVRLILKPQNDALGTGVRFVELRDGKVFDMAGVPIDVAAFGAALEVDMVRDDYLVQGFVKPHPAMAALGSGKALGTFRILAHATSGEVTLLYVLARIPCGDNVHDNFSGGRSGNLIAAVDPDSGRLQAACGRRDQRFDRLIERFDVNPDTGRPIAGESVPHWAEIRTLVERAARSFSELPVLGWDIALAEEGPLIIEANCNPDIIGAQVSLGLGARALMGTVEG